MTTRLEALISWLALPVYAWQGLAVRRNTHRMVPPKAVAFVSCKGKGTPISLLVIGDSSAAGVGVDDFSDSMAGRLPLLLSKKTGRPVNARTSGNNSATAGQIRDFVIPNLEHAKYDYIVINIGVNDAKNFHTGKRFCREFGGLLYAVHARFPDAQIIWSNILDMEKVPALPSPLNKILGIRGRILKRNGEILCGERGAHAPVSKWRPVRENFSADGFHASSEGYRIWAEEMTDYIVKLETDSKTKTSVQ